MCGFVVCEITPFAADWDKAEALPRELCRKAFDRICREVKVMMVGSGSGEIMKDLSAQ